MRYDYKWYLFGLKQECIFLYGIKKLLFILLGILLSALLSMNYFQKPNMSLSKYLNMIESRFGEPSYIKSILQCNIKFKLIAFHAFLDNRRLRACVSKMAA